MAIVILLAFILTPIIEIAVFIEVGDVIGLWPTLAIVVLTAMAGTALLRAQGLATYAAAQQSLARGEFPVREVFDGACLLFAGALLLTPGFVTDGVGMALFLPPVRRMIGRWLMARGQFQVHTSMNPGRRHDPGDGVVEGEFHEVDGDRDPDKPNRPRLK